MKRIRMPSGQAVSEHLVFLAIVLFSPDGLLGLWSKWRTRFGPTAPRRP